jgi:hypothetical protein
LRRRARASAAICLPCLCLCNNALSQVVVVTPRIFITIPSGQSMEYGTMELPPRVIRQLVTQQVTKRVDCIVARVESLAFVFCGVLWTRCDCARLKIFWWRLMACCSWGMSRWRLFRRRVWRRCRRSRRSCERGSAFVPCLSFLSLPCDCFILACKCFISAALPAHARPCQRPPAATHSLQHTPPRTSYAIHTFKHAT